MHKNKLMRALPRTLLSASLVAGIATTAGVFAVDGPTPGFFELDGDTAPSATIPGDDWDNVYLNTLTKTPAASTGIIADPAPKSIYTGGGSKDVNDVPDWKYTDGAVPDKDDITNAYATAYVNPTDVSYNGQVVHHAGDLIIYFGLDRYANNGDAFAGFWFFQKDVGLGPNGAFSGQHTARTATQHGDLLVLVEYPQASNAVPVIKVYEWDPADLDHDNIAPNLDQIYTSENNGNAKCDGTGNKLACAITNAANLPGAPAWPYTPKNGYAGIPPQSFFEGGINVSALLGGDVPCFSSFLAETRSSRSETAQLKDFVLGDFNLCSVKVTKKCAAAVNDKDGGNSVVVNFDGTVKNDGGLPMTVTVTDDNGTPADTADDKVVYGPTLLQPGDEQPYSGSFNTTAIPSTDRVTATATRGSSTVTANADATCKPEVKPAMTVSKSCSATLKADGTGVDVLFSGTLTNTGNVALKDVSVVDDNGTPGDTSDDKTVFGPTTLNAGASATYSGGFSVTGSNTSTDHVTAKGTDVLTSVAVSADASATCLADVHPNIAVSKQCTAKVNGGGDGIDVLFGGTVTNTGDVVLQNVTVVDNHGTPGNTGDDVTVLGPITLAPGASASYTGGFGAGGPSSTDIVSATGSDMLTHTPVSSNATASCAADVLPAIAVTKQCAAKINSDGTGIDVGFAGTVTNTGNVILDNVMVVDNHGTPGNTGDDVTVLGPISLAPGGSANYTGGFGASGNSSTDIVTASGSDRLTQSPVSANATASCSADVLPAITVTKQCTDAPAFGKPILFNGIVTNTGNVALTNVTVVDDNGTPGNTADDVTFNIGSLALGGSANYSGSYTPATEGTWTNTVVASGSDAILSLPVSSTASASCKMPPPQQFEGCTPGFWKNSIGSWPPTGYSPNQTVASVFTLPNGVISQLGSDTLLTALSYQGGNDLKGAAQILLRAAVSAVLNAAHPDVKDYPLSAQEVIAKVNAALATKDRSTILALASLLDGYNNLGCPLANDNSF